MSQEHINPERLDFAWSMPRPGTRFADIESIFHWLALLPLVDGRLLDVENGGCDGYRRSRML
jgi:hypothetical protein